MKKTWIAGIVCAALIGLAWDANHENRGLRQLIFEELGIDSQSLRLKECELLHLQNVCN